VISGVQRDLVVLSGQTRILFAMARDGLLRTLLSGQPAHAVAGRLHRRGRIFVACIAAFVPDAVLWELTSMGPLVAFMVGDRRHHLRHTKPDVPRGFGFRSNPVLRSSASSLHLSGLAI